MVAPGTKLREWLNVCICNILQQSPQTPDMAWFANLYPAITSRSFDFIGRQFLWNDSGHSICDNTECTAGAHDRSDRPKEQDKYALGEWVATVAHVCSWLIILLNSSARCLLITVLKDTYRMLTTLESIWHMPASHFWSVAKTYKHYYCIW